jgi:hypothetical protein
MISDHELCVCVCVCVETYPSKVYISEKESLCISPTTTTTTRTTFSPPPSMSNNMAGVVSTILMFETSALVLSDDCFFDLAFVEKPPCCTPPRMLFKCWNDRKGNLWGMRRTEAEAANSGMETVTFILNLINKKGSKNNNQSK